MIRRDMYTTGVKCAETLYRSSVISDTLETLIEDIDWYKEYAVTYSDLYFKGLADGLWALIQDHWEYVPEERVVT